MPIFKSVETPLTDAVIFESHWIVELCCLVKAFLWPVVIIKRADSFLICFDGSVQYLPTVSSLKYVFKLPLTHMPTPVMIFPSLLTSLMTHPLIEYVSVVVFLSVFLIGFHPVLKYLIKHFVDALYHINKAYGFIYLNYLLS